jgi:hypothetical protein
MNDNWSNELQALDRVGPSRDLWADALARAASPARRGSPDLSRKWAWRRRTVVLAVTALGIVGLAAAGVVAFSPGSARAAYAVTTNPDGTITITLRQLSALPDLNREFARNGIPLKAVPVTPQCAFNPVPRLPRGFIPFVPSDQALGSPLRPTDTTTIDTSQLSSERAVGLLGVSQTTSGRVEIMQAGARSPGPSCINSASFYQPEVRVTPMPVSRGEHVTLVAWVRSHPVRRCTISVYDRWDKNGPSYAQGLSTKRPVRGRVSWTWQVAANTALGRRRVVVNCGSEGSLRTYISVTK